MSSIKEDKCLRCEMIPCINLYRVENDYYGEIKAVELYSKAGYTPCIAGLSIFVSCKLLDKLLEKVDLPTDKIYLQAIRDMRTSVFLLLTGHYRSSMAILRSCLEEVLIGMYFDSKFLEAETDEAKEKVMMQLKLFYEGKYNVPKSEAKQIGWRGQIKHLTFRYIIKWLSSEKRGIRLSEKAIPKLNNLNRDLNGYVHAKILETTKSDCPFCSTLVKIDPKEFRKCVKYLQKTFAILLQLFVSYLFELNAFDDDILFVIIKRSKRDYSLDRELNRRTQRSLKTAMIMIFN